MVIFYSTNKENITPCEVKILLYYFLHNVTLSALGFSYLTACVCICIGTLEQKSKVGSGRTCHKKSRKQFSQKGFVQDPKEFKIMGFLFICLVIPNRVSRHCTE